MSPQNITEAYTNIQNLVYLSGYHPVIETTSLWGGSVLHFGALIFVRNGRIILVFLNLFDSINH